MCANNLAIPRIENSPGDPFDLLSAGPAAQNVPPQAVTVDNSSPEITYHDQSQWVHEFNTLDYYGSSMSYTPSIGGSLSYSFDGVAIWYDYPSHTSYHTISNLLRRYYSTVGPNFGFFTVSIDGSTPQRLTAKSDLFLSQRLIWSNTSLGPGRHSLTLTHDGDIGTNSSLGLDFFRSAIDNLRR